MVFKFSEIQIFLFLLPSTPNTGHWSVALSQFKPVRKSHSVLIFLASPLPHPLQKKQGEVCENKNPAIKGNDWETSGPPTLGGKGKRRFFSLYSKWSILSLLQQELQTS